MHGMPRRLSGYPVIISGHDGGAMRPTDGLTIYWFILAQGVMGMWLGSSGHFMSPYADLVWGDVTYVRLLNINGRHHHS